MLLVWRCATPKRTQHGMLPTVLLREDVPVSQEAALHRRSSRTKKVAQGVSRQDRSDVFVMHDQVG